MVTERGSAFGCALLLSRASYPIYLEGAGGLGQLGRFVAQS